MEAVKPGSACSVLVVDDDPTNLKFTRVLLEYEGYSVRVASSAEEALAMLKTFQPRLILLDLRLPGMDGFELARRIRADPATAGALIVAATACTTRADEEKALAAGCNAYVSKPLDTRALARLLAASPPVGP
ncbi:MAG: response regulator [Candidatus Riflebacteria bacterium]|nr:response regulator [Candidatus Riflebacteria bacterium]